MSDAQQPVIYWFRQDLRLTDLPGLTAAVATGQPVLACYFLDDETPGDWAPGGASRWWLHHSLVSLDTALRERGGALLVRRGKAAVELQALVEESGATAVFCSEHYEPWNRDLQGALVDALGEYGIPLHLHPGVLLRHPDTITTQSGGNFKVFTAYWRASRRGLTAPDALPAPKKGVFLRHELPGLPSEQWQLLPESPNWAAHWPELWQPGEDGAAKALDTFLSGSLGSYHEARDLPGVRGTSRLSPHLHLGEISPAQVWRAVQGTAVEDGKASDSYLGELGWREFNYYLLYHHPHIPEQPFKTPFKSFPWLAREDWFERWKRGNTGYPLVDAGMRELWHTGFMHNRVRMVSASFLTKHLLLPWQWGARWFWDTLVDADLANNSGGWQWVAGCGADAAPYFRIFNPVLQGEKFDSDGDYVRHWVPELAALPDKYLQAPWTAPAKILDHFDIELGTTYPEPVVDHKEARAAALSAYDVLPSASSG